MVYKDKIEIVSASSGEEEGPTVVVLAKLAHRNRAKVLDDGTARPDLTIVRAMARAHEWRGWPEQDEVDSYRGIANKAEMDASYVQLVLPPAFLDTQITRELPDGRVQVSGGLLELLPRDIPADWQQQRVLFQFTRPEPGAKSMLRTS